MKPDLAFIVFNATGTQVTSGAATARVAIPNDASGNKAKYVRLQSTGNAYVRFGDNTVVATANDLLLSPNEGVLFNVNVFTNMAYLQETASAKINITPLEVG